MIPDEIITAWGNQAPWRDKGQIEQDLILHTILQIVYANTLLRDHLAFRGGTCLNKLFWEVPFRYSEDLDFVQIHAEPIGTTIQQLRQVLDPLFPQKPAWEKKSRGFQLFYRYPPQGSPSKRQKIKKVVRIYLAYCNRDGKEINGELFSRNLEEKLSDPAFVQDMGPLLRPGIAYNASQAANFVKTEMLSHLLTPTRP